MIGNSAPRALSAGMAAAAAIFLMTVSSSAHLLAASNLIKVVSNQRIVGKEHY